VGRGVLDSGGIGCEGGGLRVQADDQSAGSESYRNGGRGYGIYVSFLNISQKFMQGALRVNYFVGLETENSVLG